MLWRFSSLRAPLPSTRYWCAWGDTERNAALSNLPAHTSTQALKTTRQDFVRAVNILYNACVISNQLFSLSLFSLWCVCLLACLLAWLIFFGSVCFLSFFFLFSCTWRTTADRLPSKISALHQTVGVRGDSIRKRFSGTSVSVLCWN